MAIPPHRDGQAGRRRAVGMAARRPPRDRQLLRARRPGGDDAALRRIGTGRRDVGKVQRHLDPPGGAERGPGPDQRARRNEARQGHPARLEDRERQPHRSLEGQRRPRLRGDQRRRPVGDRARAATPPDRALRRQHGRRACAGEDGRSPRASGANLVRVDRQDRARQRLLLPHPQPGDPDRVRPSAAGRHPAPDRGSVAADGGARAHGGAHPERERLREGSPPPALPAASAPSAPPPLYR